MVNLKVEIYNVFRFQNYFFGEHMSARLKGDPTMSLVDTYVKEISELLKNCDDESLLDLIYQLLKKHSAQT